MSRILGPEEPMDDEEMVQLESGLIVPRHVGEEARHPRPTMVELFAGAGGFGLGFIRSGFEVVCASDNDPWCAITYLCNLGEQPVQMHFVTPDDEDRMERTLRKHMGLDGKKKLGILEPSQAGTGWIKAEREAGRFWPGVRHYWLGDIRQMTGAAVLKSIGMEEGEVDCVTGGPPCQGFSYAGRRNVEDPRNSLVFEFARMVLEIRPKTLVMENVPGITKMVTPDGVPVIDALCLILERGGFGTFDALRKSLQESPTRRVAVRGKDQVRPKEPGKRPHKREIKKVIETPRRRGGRAEWVDLPLFKKEPKP